jgi:glycosyltransferase involved in cell wall biosynthesis
MENVAKELYEHLRHIADVELVAIRGKRGGKNALLPVAYAVLLIRAVKAAYHQNPDIIYVQDGVMAPMGRLLRWILRRPVVITIHGTEVAYSNPVYRKLIFPSLQRMNRAVVISDGTAAKTRAVMPNLPLTKVVWGSEADLYLETPRPEIRRQVEAQIGVPLEGRPCIYHSGRLIERKGALWFVENVMPLLHECVPNIICLIAGHGEDYDKLAVAIQRLQLTDAVKLLGYVLGEERRRLYNVADIFVMPNVPGYGFEGFGMVAIEASSCGTPVVASRYEGITDAVIDGRTGWLLPTLDAQAFTDTIAQELREPSLDRESVRANTLATFSWEQTAEGYRAIFEQVLESN